MEPLPIGSKLVRLCAEILIATVLTAKVYTHMVGLDRSLTRMV